MMSERGGRGRRGCHGGLGVGVVVAISSCGIGRDGGHMVIGWPGGKVTAIDFNSTAPAAAREDMFLQDGGGIRARFTATAGCRPARRVTLAGLQLALDRYGTRDLSQVIEPAIRFARDGFVINTALAGAIRVSERQFRKMKARRGCFCRKGVPAGGGQPFPQFWNWRGCSKPWPQTIRSRRFTAA